MSFNIASAQVGATNIKFSLAGANLETPNITLSGIDSARIHVSVDSPDSIVVGGTAHAVHVSILGTDGTPITGLSGVASLSFPKLSGTLSGTVVTIKDGTTTDPIALVPQFVAGNNLTLSVTMPGITTVDGNTVNILADSPMSIGMTVDHPQMEATAGSTSAVHATLYDRYGNIVMNAPSYSIRFNIPTTYRDQVNFGSGQYMQKASFQNGVADTTIGTTGISGTSYIVGTVTPALEKNSFTVANQDGQSVTVQGVSSNTVSIQTHAVFDAKSLTGMHYNSLYTVLQGADYGDITKPGYLGGEVIFNPSSRSLAVTSLLNDTSEHTTVFSLTPAGKYTAPPDGSTKNIGLDPEIMSDNNRSYVGFYDTYSKTYIARAWFGFDGSSDTLLPCAVSGDPTSLANCTVPADPNQAFIMMKGGTGTTTAKEDQSMTLMSSNNQMLVVVHRSGKLDLGAGVSLQLDNSQSANLLGINVLLGRTIVGYVAMHFTPGTGIDVHHTSDVSQALSSAHNNLILEWISSTYTPHVAFVGNSTHAPTGIEAYAPDTASTLAVDSDLIGSNSNGLEQYHGTEGIGWSSDNHTILDVAGGSTVGEATKFYQTYSTINLGDPVAHLTPKQTTTDYDQTVGTEVFHGTDGDPIDSYAPINLRGNNSNDIVVFLTSGKIGVLLNENGAYRDRGTLLDVTDMGKSLHAVGDFGAKGYDDIAAVSAKTGNLILLDNRAGVFTRKTPNIVDTANKPTTLSGGIIQLEAFDMDQDGHTDLVTLDEGGELSILYGRSDSLGQTYFMKRILDTQEGIALSA